MERVKRHIFTSVCSLQNLLEKCRKMYRQRRVALILSMQLLNQVESAVIKIIINYA